VKEGRKDGKKMKGRREDEGRSEGRMLTYIAFIAVITNQYIYIHIHMR
jgi:hypothetical protein